MTKVRQQIRLREASMARLFSIILITLLVLIGLSYRRLEGQAPGVTFDREFETLGRTSSLGLTKIRRPA